MKSAPATRLVEEFAKLPTSQRVAIGLALKDLADELLTAPPAPTAREKRFARLAELENEFRNHEPGDRVTKICERMGFAPATYFRWRKQLIESGVILTSLT